MAIVSKNIPAPDSVKIKRALISVFDKTNLIDLANKLASLGIEIISTGGSAKFIADAGIKVTDVSQITHFPEIMDGRVKTLHPGVHGGLLAIRGDETHVQAMNENDIATIDLLICNLYPFAQTVAGGADFANCVENIDIGGPAMIRAASKNHSYVTVITNPADYEELLQMLVDNDGCALLDFRKKMAAKAFGLTAHYDAAISNWLVDNLEIDFPQHRTLGGTLSQIMRYGENPHQKAGFYVSGDQRAGVATARQIQGKQLSYNNINDTDAAFELVSEFDPEKSAAIAIIKHANPCGVAQGETLSEAYDRALACDTVSAFGGIIALNRVIDADVATKIVEIFTEVIIAPDATEEARAIIAQKKNLRLLLTDGLADVRSDGISAKTVSGGLLVQSRDNGNVDDLELKVVTKRQPTADELADLKFAFRVCKHVKSNAIIYVKDGATVGIGAGQMSRVDSSRIAARKAVDAAGAGGADQSLTKGSVVASDAFFPFADGLLSAIEAGATAVIQPGGSMRDDEVIAAADEAGIAMVFTGMRHFRH
ncbi:MAG: bifunctional phosphoribosylaminoimidazolecarboxamide formyltransferase/IMP cyclohydrolase [Hyphomicrobiales bacterium]|nr:bifunctional phosphoribosylaminoimidazolecarboxamide formyltransferase/IMP cyclohydrolase [Hyphomicrobiales bacterium]